MMKKSFAALTLAAALTLTVFAAPARVPLSVHAAAAYSSVTAADYAHEVADIVNRERAAAGLAPVTYSDRLSQAALVRASEIRTAFSHTRPDGTSCFTALKEAGVTYRSAGENIAYGQRTPEEVMAGWMNSPGHRANILGESYTYIGVGAVYENGVWYWTQFFAAADNPDGAVSTTKAASTPPATASAPSVTASTSASTAPASAPTTSRSSCATPHSAPTTSTSAPTDSTSAEPSQPTGQAETDVNTWKQALLSRLMTALEEKWQRQNGNCG